ncbi:glycosyl hydrolase family 28-related protein [Chryseobacterium sp.]|uniref:glycosyl hydrolase family 28-related protein n=1 Tax=Chryseobacterium sp. TaxID=1871047 RepID=UPI00388D6A86
MEKQRYNFLLFIFLVLIFNKSGAQQLGFIVQNDKYTNEAVSFEEVSEWINGSKIDDTKVDGIIYIKKNGKYYRRVYFGQVNVKWFYAQGNGQDDDTDSFVNAINYIKASNGGVLYIPKGEYILKKTLNIDFDNLVIQGDGAKNSVLKIQHLGIGISYKSKVPDLSTARFTLYNLSLVNTINKYSLPQDNMKGTGVHCKEMHSSDWRDVYIENFLNALILEESYLNIFTNYFSQSNWVGIKTLGGSNGNTFYNGAQRNSSIDLRSLGAEKNLFINIDIEPASNTQYVGNNNTFQNCRFERFNLLSRDYKKPWFVLGSNNKFENCDWHWNFEDQPQDYMMIIEGIGNKVFLGNTNTTAKLVLLRPNTANNYIEYSGEFNDFEITNTLRYSSNYIQDLGINNNIIFKNSEGTVEYLGSEYFSSKIKSNNILQKNWLNKVDVNMNSISFSASDILSPLGFPLDMTKKITIIDTKYVRRAKLSPIELPDGKTKFSVSAWVFIPPAFKGTYIAISAVEGKYISLFINNENRNKWVRISGFAMPDKNEVVQFCIDTDAEKNSFFYLSIPALAKGLNPIPIY